MKQYHVALLVGIALLGAGGGIMYVAMEPWTGLVFALGACFAASGVMVITNVLQP